MIDFGYIDREAGDLDGFTIEDYVEDQAEAQRMYGDHALVSHVPETAEARASAMLALLERPEWHEWAACRGMAGFFDLPAAEASKRCDVCPVTDECRTAGLKQSYGVWDGEEKRGLEPVVDELADRIVDTVNVKPYVLTMKGIESTVGGAAVRRIRETVKRLVAEGRIAQYDALRGSGRGRAWTILYGPGER